MKLAFPDVKAVARPLVENYLVPHPEWIAGFTSGDGSFSVGISSSPHTSTGLSVLLEFKLTQQARDIRLLESFVSYFGCGNIYIRSKENTTRF